MRDTAAVLGSPISHSLSPLIHNYVYRKLGIKAEYIAVELAESEFIDWITKAINETRQWFGFSLTMPLKEVVCSPELRGIISVDEVSNRIASANTLYFSEETWRATSTDVLGICSLLKSRSFKRVAILGAGGTSRAALAALARLPECAEYEVYIYRRSAHRDDALRAAAPLLNLEIQDWALIDSEKDFDLLINTVPNDGITPIVEKIGQSRIVFDALYHPWKPALTKLQLARGGELISGLEFLAAQAIPQIHLMTGQSFDDATLFAELVQLLESNF